VRSLPLILCLGAAWFAGTPAPVEAQSVPDWSGFYVGVHVGIPVGQGSAEATEDSEGVPYNAFGDQWTFDLDGKTSFAVQVGYNRQRARLVYGAQVDFGQYRFEGSGPSGLSEDTVASSEGGVSFGVRGRLGYAWGRLLTFGTAGFASTRVSSSIIDDCADDPCGQVRIDAADKSFETGAMFGLGAEYALARVSGVALSLTGEWVRLVADGAIYVAGVDDFGDSHAWHVVTTSPRHSIRFGVNARFR
jgi:outer membrane immunogenic protein